MTARDLSSWRSLLTPPLAAEEQMDCRNNPCDFSLDLSGQRTSGRCRCWDAFPFRMPPDVRVAVRKTVSEARSILAARDAEIERLKALVEKRERQLVWAIRACGDDEALKFYGLDILAVSDDAGLLAAIDEACPEEAK